MMNYNIQGSKWLVPIKPNSNAKLRLICFAYAGASASVYANWLKIPVDSIEIIAVQLPGRGSRISEPLISDMESLVSSFYSDLVGVLDLPFVMFGHSLGAKFAYASLLQIIKNNHRLPEHVVISASSAPHLFNDQPMLHQQSDVAFIQKLREMDGTPEDILNSREMMALLLPILRADCRLTEMYQAAVPMSKINCECTLLAGTEDKSILLEDVQAWSEHFVKPATFCELSAGHMFLESHSELVLQTITKILHAAIKKCDQAKRIDQTKQCDQTYKQCDEHRQDIKSSQLSLNQVAKVA